jgi:hypothetical protein
MTGQRTGTRPARGLGRTGRDCPVPYSVFLFLFVLYGNDNTLNTHKKWARGTRLG